MKKTQVKKIEPYSPYWEKLANSLARDFAPPIYPCKKCSYPCVQGYCCNHCGDANPHYTEEQERNL